MKALIQSAMIFFGTLMAAAVVALGEPAQSDVAFQSRATTPAPRVAAGQNRNGQNGSLIGIAMNRGAALPLR